MIPADKIKWIVENIKPEGFYQIGDKAFAFKPYDKRAFYYTCLDREFENLFYPLFLQRVIESVNRIEDTHTRIIYGCSEYGRKPHVSGADYKSFKPLFTYYEKDFDFIDEAKEKAILYIVDKIRGEG